MKRDEQKEAERSKVSLILFPGTFNIMKSHFAYGRQLVETNYCTVKSHTMFLPLDHWIWDISSTL